jgi:sulfoxide reductase catalytic subunit YedY
MVAFDAAHRAVHYPADRRFRVWIRPSLLALVALLVVIPVAMAWIETTV